MSCKLLVRALTMPASRMARIISVERPAAEGGCRELLLPLAGELADRRDPINSTKAFTCFRARPPRQSPTRLMSTGDSTPTTWHPQRGLTKRTKQPLPEQIRDQGMHPKTPFRAPSWLGSRRTYGCSRPMRVPLSYKHH